MGRPPLSVGTHGKITTKRDGEGWRSRTFFRDYDGERREISRWARTKNAAEAALALAIRDRQTPTSDEITGETRVRKLAELWQVTWPAADLSVNTQRVYANAIDKHILPALGALRLRELSVTQLDRMLATVRERDRLGAAKTARSVLSGMLGYAVRNNALPSNPARDTAPISRKTKKDIRALTRDETVDLSMGLRAYRRAVDLDLPDLVDWMLGTGMRIGEACAVRSSVLVENTVTVNATVVRVKGRGLVIQEQPKSAAGVRTLTLPPNLVGLLDRRAHEPRVRGPFGIVFASPRGKLRDPNNTSGDLREVLDDLGWSWVTSHTFRKTVATRLDEAGFTGREVADILGHEKPSMTLDVYMGRKVVSARMAEVLNRE